MMLDDWLLHNKLEYDDFAGVIMEGDLRNTDEDILYVECTNDFCNWQGMSNECHLMHSKGPLLCPMCHEIAEPR